MIDLNSLTNNKEHSISGNNAEKPFIVTNRPLRKFLKQYH